MLKEPTSIRIGNSTSELLVEHNFRPKNMETKTSCDKTPMEFGEVLLSLCGHTCVKFVFMCDGGSWRLSHKHCASK